MGPARCIGRETRRDRRVVHYIMKRTTLHCLLSKLPGFLFCEATQSESGSSPIQFRIELRLSGLPIGSINVGRAGAGDGVNVVGIGGPAEERGPPGGRSSPAILVWFSSGSGRGPDLSGQGAVERDSRGHGRRERRIRKLEVFSGRKCNQEATNTGDGCVPCQKGDEIVISRCERKDG
ncbi:hypothetical protein GH714_000155 [Hevea brasiliensis]|uniref:Uncharacterized protein n=1 Tax=Hevea brasiliensis TaxID=3981 RepID=A0A6A6LAX3_HEVBR|nr:hypothetical protein GH714_000155 [Hevea brasiliensis]